MRLLDYVCEKLVLPDLRPQDKADALSAMAQLLRRADRVKDPQRLLGDLLARERMMSTGIGEGIAIPHTTSDEVTEPVIAIGKVKDGVDFESLDGRPVYTLFLLVGPKDAADLHIKVLARIARLAKRPSFIAAFKSARSSQDIIQAILQQEDERATEEL